MYKIISLFFSTSVYVTAKGKHQFQSLVINKSTVKFNLYTNNVNNVLRYTIKGRTFFKIMLDNFPLSIKNIKEMICHQIVFIGEDKRSQICLSSSYLAYKIHYCKM